MAKLGAAFMLGGLVTAATLLLVRSRISQELGLDATLPIVQELIAQELRLKSVDIFDRGWGAIMTYLRFMPRDDGAESWPRLP